MRHKIVGDFEVQTDYRILAKSSDLGLIENLKNIQIKKRTCLVDFTILADDRVKIKESERTVKYFDHTREKKAVKHDSDGGTTCNWCTWNGPQKFEKSDWKIWKS